MILRHATTKSSLSAITDSGKLDPECSQGKLKAVWLHSPSRTAWAILHVQARHKVSVDDVVVLELQIARRQVVRRKSGLWSSQVAIPITRMVNYYEAKCFYASPMEG